MRTPTSWLVWRASRTLMNAPSSLNHRPEARSWPIAELMARIFTFCACSSAHGATHSPVTKVSTTNARPTLASASAARRGERPEARITVYSELLARCASTYMVPISTTTGSSS